MDFKTITYSLDDSFPYTGSTISADAFLLNSGSSWEDITTSATTTNTSAINFRSLNGVNYGIIGSVWYFGKIDKFDTIGLQFAANTDNTTTRTVTWEYWNGSAWQLLEISGTGQTISAQNGNLDFENSGTYLHKLNTSIYDTWTTTSVNGSSNLYFIRCTIGTSSITSGTFSSLSLWDHVSRLGKVRFDKILTTVDDLSFTDFTTAGASNTSGAFTFTSNTTNARLYLGLSNKNITGFRTILSTAGSTGTVELEYWNGSIWTTLPREVFGSFSTNVADLYQFKSTNTCNRVFSPPLDWTTTSINSISLYWIRFRVTVAYVTQPIFQLIDAFRTKTISKNIYIPEVNNRYFSSVFAKVHIYNPVTNASLSRLSAISRIDSNDYIPCDVGSSYDINGNFKQIGGRIFSTTADDGIFTDETDDASDSGTNDVTITNSVNANVYFCWPNNVKWSLYPLSLRILPNAAFVGGECEWEYWNGSSWTIFEPEMVYGASKNLNFNTNASHTIQLPYLSGWTTTIVNGFTGYCIRRRITTQYSTATGWSQIATTFPGINEFTLTNNGESLSSAMLIDLTEVFKQQFIGTSGTCELQIGCSLVSNFVADFPFISGELYITYGADEQDIRIKTIHIPLDSIGTNLTSSLTSIGTNQIPQLSTYLPESGKTIRNFYIVATGNDSATNIIHNEFVMRLDSDTPKYTFGYSSYGQSASIFKFVFEKNDIDTVATHDIQMAITGRLLVRNFSLYAVVTYEYDASITTRAINSLVIPWETQSIFIPQDDPTHTEKIRKSFYIQEPGTIDNENVGVYLSFTDISTPILQYKEKSESTYIRYTWQNPALTVGGYRFGKILPTQNLSRGLNQVGIDVYGEMETTTKSSIAYLCGYFMINYQSDVFSEGVEKHNKTVYRLALLQQNTLQRNKGTNHLTAPIQNYYLNELGFWGEFSLLSATNPGGTFDNRLLLESNNETLSRALFGSGGVWMENESCLYDFIIANRGVQKKYPQYNMTSRPVNIFTDGGDFNIEYGYITTTNGTWGGLHTVVTYHEITYTITGQTLGTTSTGLTVTFYDDETSAYLFDTTTDSGGTFSTIWYDNTRNIVCDVYDPNLDRYVESSPGIAGVDTFELNFSTDSPKSYGFIS